MADGIKQYLMRQKPERVQVRTHTGAVMAFRLLEALDDAIVVEGRIIIPFTTIRFLEILE